eukprot:gene7384-508_t
MSGSDSPSNKSIKLFSTKTPGKKMDRFIPNRSAMDIDMSNFNLTKENGGAAAGSETATSPSKEEYKKLLGAALSVEGSSRILAFKHKAPAPPEGHDSGLRGLYNDNLGPIRSSKQFRHIPQTQERILDAPELMDDYYLNLLDWNEQNVIAVALGGTVYLWNAGSGSVEELCSCPNEGDYICSVAWGADGQYLALGTSDSKVQIWDAARGKQIRELSGHTNRVSCVAWNGTTLSSAGRDSTIRNWDVRKRRDEACVATLTAHEQEVCILKWSPCGNQLASGGNDNNLCIWDSSYCLPHKVCILKWSPCGNQLASGGNDNNLCIWDSSYRLLHKVNAHQAAVKGMAWCPFQSNLLATGGGTADRCIKFWNTHTGALLSSIDTGSQVCALQWNRHEKELLSSHGYSKNQLCLWKYPSLAKIGELTGHQGRVLHMATSPDGSSVVTAGADETLRFWRVFGDPPLAKDESKIGGTGATAGHAPLGGLRSIR